MLRMGLTGGIASGKTAVAAILREMEFPVLEADVVARTLMDPGQSAHDEVLREFGAELANPNGVIDRSRLAAIVFADNAKLAKLNVILHPRVEEIVFRQFGQWEDEGAWDAAFVEAALLLEAGYADRLNGLVVVYCKPEQQVERLLARGMSEAEARQRIGAQMPAEEKLRYATDKIDCSGTMEQTWEQVKELAERIRKSRVEKRG
jgi:dephospho-CoA kinase